MVNGAIHFEGNYLYQNKKYTSTNASVGLVLRSSTNGSASTIMATQIKGYYDTGISIVGGSGHQILGTIATRPPEFIYALGTAIYRKKLQFIVPKLANVILMATGLQTMQMGLNIIKFQFLPTLKPYFKITSFWITSLGWLWQILKAL